MLIDWQFEIDGMKKSIESVRKGLRGRCASHIKVITQKLNTKMGKSLWAKEKRHFSANSFFLTPEETSPSPILPFPLDFSAPALLLLVCLNPYMGSCSVLVSVWMFCLHEVTVKPLRSSNNFECSVCCFLEPCKVASICTCKYINNNRRKESPKRQRLFHAFRRPGLSENPSPFVVFRRSDLSENASCC